MSANQKPGILGPLKPYKLSEELYRQPKGAIFSSHFKPGDKLPSEKRSSETLGVGRPAIREALSRLESSGMISVRPDAGDDAFVPIIDSSILTDTFEGMVGLDNVSLEELTEARATIELPSSPDFQPHGG
jgi:DNA-binding FadR family transcriptional regulator